MKRRTFMLGTAAVLAASSSPAAAQAPRAVGVALVLGGGGCRGYGHIGVIRALERAGLKPDLVVGSSVGSLVGALYAAGNGSDALERYGQSLSPNMLRDWVFPKLGLFGGKRISRFVTERAGVSAIEALPMRFAAIATDLRTGERVTLTRGNLGRAVQASSSLPGLIEPARIGNRILVDGNLAAPVPVDAARLLGARRVIAVDVSFPPEQADLNDPFDALYQGFSILTHRLAQKELARADVPLKPELPEHHEMGPATQKALIAAGEQAATQAMGAIRALFQSAATRQS